MRARIYTFFILTLLVVSAAAQSVTGCVIDAKTREALPFVIISYEGGRLTQSDENGNYKLRLEANGKLRFSMIGYESKTLRTKKGGTYNISLEPLDTKMNEAVVTGKKNGRYSRKNNPAVELMRRVIAAKDSSDIRDRHDFCSFDQYSKMTLAFDDITPKVFEDDKFKSMPFLKDYVETCNETGTRILPISVEERVVRNIYRRSPKTEKRIVIGEKTQGINELLSTGDILNTMLKDVFTDVNIYKNSIYLMHHDFLSPLASNGAIAFYRYFIVDTLRVANDSCIQVDFTPNNPQDYGFSGSLYIMADSTYRVKRAEIGFPKRTDVNFVDRMRIIQEFETLPTGERVLVSDNMLVQLKVANFLQKFLVKRVNEYANYSFEPIADKNFRFSGDEMTDPNARMRDEAFWDEHRSVPLTRSEGDVNGFVQRLQQIKWFKPILFVGRAFIENFVETSTDPKRPSKVDIGPVNTTITKNSVDGLRLRLSAQTTANLHPHLFLKGYVAYGFKDNKWKGLGEVTYSINKKGYLPREFPVNNITFTYNRDVMAPTDKFLATDKDNVFVSFKWTDVDHMMYYENYKLAWDREWGNGLRLHLQARTQKDIPTRALFYQPLNTAPAPSQDASLHLHSMRTNEGTFTLTFQPGAKYVNTKQRRLTVNHNAPIYELTYTGGWYDLAGQHHSFHTTEASIYKRFWLRSWGKAEVYLKGGAQWSRVPFPLLLMPAANLSYIKQRNTFELIDNMEFLNDRYAQLMLSWDLDGKLFNRIPLLKRLKWREYLACHMLWGTLTDRNNPFLARNAGDGRLFYFPGNFDADGNYQYLSRTMDPKKPYVEVVAGIHNIFKLVHVEYVHRLTYLDQPDTSRWGIRLRVMMSF